MIKPGDRFRFPHPQTGVVETFEVTNASGPQIELKAVTGNYSNDLARTVTALEADIRRHRLLADDEIRLLAELNESARGRTISGNRPRHGMRRLVDENLATSTVVSIDSVLYEITDSGRRVLADQTKGCS